MTNLVEIQNLVNEKMQEVMADADYAVANNDHLTYDDMFITWIFKLQKVAAETTLNSEEKVIATKVVIGKLSELVD